VRCIICWYTESKKTIDTIFGEGADLFIDLLAATSPRKQVKANWNLAKRIYFAHINGREIPTRGLLPAHKGNIERALKGESLSGNKVAAFAANLKGNLSRVTIDIWVLRYFNSDKSSLTPKQYAIMEKKIQKLARRHKMQPASYQAMIWEKSIRSAGKKPVSYTGVSDINQKKFAFMGGE
jgi:hypothetical protein